MSIALDTYLTVDLDYWMNHSNENIHEMIDFLNAIKRCCREIHVVKYHNEIIPHIAKFPDVTRLINVDFHSDIADVCIECRDLRDFNEGTWVNFVHGIQRKEFIWRFPSPKKSDLLAGFCHEFESPFHMTPTECRSIGWNKITMKHGLPRSRDLMRCAAFGVCVSPNWAPRSHNIAPAALLADLGFIDNKDVRKLSNSNCSNYIRNLDRKLYNALSA